MRTSILPIETGEGIQFMRYLALLRGVNAGSSNKVSMDQLAACFEACGLDNVSTYGNSGNVLFEADAASHVDLAEVCAERFLDRFGFTVGICVLSAAELRRALESRPEWWASEGDWRNDAVFVIAPVEPEEVLEVIGPTEHEQERVAHHGPVIFWSVRAASYARSRLAQLAALPVYENVTLRSSTTTMRLARRLGIDD